MLILTAAIVSCASALAAALLGSWVNSRRQQELQLIPLAQHGDELRALRSRYRRRFRALRDTLDDIRHEGERLGMRLCAAESHRDTTASQLAAAHVEVTALRQRIGAMEAQYHAQGQVIERLQQREQSVAAELVRAQEAIAGFENDHGLLRIERDELVARTQRLRTLSAAESPEPAPEGAEAAAAIAAASRAELADRSARIHELECQLQQYRGRLREVESELHTWKYRIAPLALHLKIQRDRARPGAGDPAADDQASSV